MYRNEEVIKAYIGTPNKYEWYSSAFSNFSPSGFSWKWSWYGCLFGPIYLAYRKCYLETIIIMIATSMIMWATMGIGSILSMIVTGGVAPYLIYRRYIVKVKMAEEKNLPYEEEVALIASYGGVNKLARNLMILFIIVQLLVECF